MGLWVSGSYDLAEIMAIRDQLHMSVNRKFEENMAVVTRPRESYTLKSHQKSKVRFRANSHTKSRDSM